MSALCGSLRELVAVASLRALAAEPLTGHVVREVWRVIPRLAEHLTLHATVRLSLVQPAVRPLLHGALAALQLPEAGLALTAVDGTLVGVRSGGAGGGGGRSHAARKLPFALGDDELEHETSMLEVEGLAAGLEGPYGYDEATAGFWLLGVAAPVVASSRASGSDRDASTAPRSTSWREIAGSGSSSGAASERLERPTQRRASFDLGEPLASIAPTRRALRSEAPGSRSLDLPSKPFSAEAAEAAEEEAEAAARGMDAAAAMTPPPGQEEEEEVQLVLVGMERPRLEQVLRAVETGCVDACRRATQQLLLEALHESRAADARLADGGAFAVPERLVVRLELHERLRADLPRALNHACTALQPLAVQEGPLFDLGLGHFTHSFVYRQAREEGQEGGGLRGDRIWLLYLTALAEASEAAPAALQLRVCGLWEPTDELAGGLVRHLHDKLNEATLQLLSLLLRRNPETRLSPADMGFLRPPQKAPLAAATLPLPLPPLSALTNPGRPLAAAAAAATAAADAAAAAATTTALPSPEDGGGAGGADEWLEWLHGAQLVSRLRAAGWHPLHLLSPLAEGEAMALLHLPSAAAAPPQAPPHMRRGATTPRVALDQARSASPSLYPLHRLTSSLHVFPTPSRNRSPRIARPAHPTHVLTRRTGEHCHSVIRASRCVRASLLTSSRHLCSQGRTPWADAHLHLAVPSTLSPWCRLYGPHN